MAIPDNVKANFETLKRAAQSGDLVLMECTDAATGEIRHVICAVNSDGINYDFVPFGHMCPNPNPFEAYVPPTAS